MATCLSAASEAATYISVITKHKCGLVLVLESCGKNEDADWDALDRENEVIREFGVLSKRCCLFQKLCHPLSFCLLVKADQR